MTKIEWTEKTWNPIIGCSKVSEGCKYCYAEVMSRRLASMDNTTGEDYKQVISDKGKFNGNVLFRPEKLIIKSNKPLMIFVNSMSDLFHDKIDYGTIVRIIATMNNHPEHTFQVLTKRPENALKFFEWYQKRLPDNVWLGVSVEMRKYLNRIKVLDMLPAKIRFISFEPLLEDIGEVDLTGVNWVIVGGESGKGKRPFNPDWARNILKQCREQGIAFFMKQIDKIQSIPEDLMIREYPQYEGII